MPPAAPASASRLGVGPWAAWLLGVMVGALCMNLVWGQARNSAGPPLVAAMEHGAVQLSSPPASSQNFSLGNLESVMERAASLAPSLMPKTVMVAVVNSGFSNLTLNFILHVRKLRPRIRNVVFVALDRPCYLFLIGINELAYFDPDLEANFSSLSRSNEFRDANYNQIVSYKWRLSHRVLSMGFNLLSIDVDIVLKRNIFAYMIDMPECDLTVTTDAWGPGILLNSDSRYAKQGREQMSTVYMNTGLLFWRKSEKNLELIDDFLQNKWRKPGFDDQEEFDLFMLERQRKSGARTHVSLSLREVMQKKCATYAGLSIHVLSPCLFPNLQQLQYESPIMSMVQTMPYFIHFNYLPNVGAKQQHMAKLGMWLVV